MATKTDEKDYTVSTTTTAAPEGEAKSSKKKESVTTDAVEDFHVPVTPDEIAERGTALAEAGSESTGGFFDPFAIQGSTYAGGPPKMTRVWSMDNDHTTANRGGVDPLKPDCSVES